MSWRNLLKRLELIEHDSPVIQAAEEMEQRADPVARQLDDLAKRVLLASERRKRADGPPSGKERRKTPDSRLMTAMQGWVRHGQH